LRRQLIEAVLDRGLEHDLTVTISAGVAVYPQSGDLAGHILGAADAALYQAKAQGRDRVVVAGTLDIKSSDSQS
jgi:diguanylate cyclase (GGDEF)-like protein